VEGMAEEMTIEERIRQEEEIKEKRDEKGSRWRKIYFGGGAHFRNWLQQCEEVYGAENLETEEIDSTGFKCFEEGSEKMYRIWVRVEEKEQ